MDMTNVIYANTRSALWTQVHKTADAPHKTVKLEASVHGPPARHHAVLLDEFHTAP